jgi:hypothetical protein
MAKLLHIAALGAAFLAGQATELGFPPQDIWYHEEQIIECDTDSDCEDKNPQLIDRDDVHADVAGGQ